MARVFISYRHENDEHQARVRAFCERISGAGIEVILDQFYLEAHPGGPDEGFPQWCKREAGTAEKILIVGSAGWFRCYEGTEMPGVGLGAAAEARVIAQRLYDSSGVNRTTRIVLFDTSAASYIPLDLRCYRSFDFAADLGDLTSWIIDNKNAERMSQSASDRLWPTAPPDFAWRPADCESIQKTFSRLLTADSSARLMLIRGSSDTGKSYVTRTLFGLAIGCDWLTAGRFDMKSGVNLNGELSQFINSLAVDYVAASVPKRPLREHLDGVLNSLRGRARPTLLIFDSFEQGGDCARWVEDVLLLACLRCPWLRIVIAGQRVPACAGPEWESKKFASIELQRLGWREWHRYGLRYRPDLNAEFVQQIHAFARGSHGLLDKLLGPAVI